MFRRSMGVVVACCCLLVATSALSIAPIAVATTPGAKGRIAFVSQTAGTRSIYSMNPDGSDPTLLSSQPADWGGDPRWSPDGTKIAFFRFSPSGEDVFVMEADGSGLTQVTHTHSASYNASLTWSPDGAKIAFAMTLADQLPGSRTQLFVMNSDGSDLAQITSAGWHWEPDWSPDGTTIAFIGSGGSFRPRHAHLFTVAPDGTGLARIQTGDVWLWGPRWSPDGTEIMYYGEQGIYTVNADGSGRALIRGTSHAYGPEWSPDGTMFVFSRGAHGAIRVANIDGSNQVKLTEPTPNPWQYYTGSPSWQAI